MTETATIYELPRRTLADIPSVLRSIADQMEAGDYGEAEGAVLVLENTEGEIRTFGAGSADWYRAFALLHLGLEHLARQRDDESFV